MLRDEISGVLYSKNDGQRHPIFSQFGVNSENDDMKQISSDFHRCNSRQRWCIYMKTIKRIEIEVEKITQIVYCCLQLFLCLFVIAVLCNWNVNKKLPFSLPVRGGLFLINGNNRDSCEGVHCKGLKSE